MVIGLITEEKQKEICDKLIEYYQELYPEVEFELEEDEFDREEIGEIYYTYPGEETKATAQEKMRMISSAIGQGYDTPIIVLRKKGEEKDILLDGHRRVRVIYSEGLSWRSYVIVPDKEVSFGMEETIKGQVKELF